ncbi:hypothetical protein GCM10009087_03300 [Sphingomonas oligophenolica]|uniref:Uncharacterized protein n=1 Tax=Sphingomonas oligophenolica TaxID=301154 RepID=A0ABU9Y0I3_9SPHN
MLIVALALEAVQPPPADNGWARFSAHQARSRIAVDVAIGTTRSASGKPVYWVRRTTKRPGQWAEVSRTDSVRCPAVLTMLRSMRDLPAPRPAPPLLDNADIVVTADGTGYELHAPAAYPGKGEGEMTLSSNIGTPLADWVERSLAALRPCLPPVL